MQHVDHIKLCLPRTGGGGDRNLSYNQYANKDRPRDYLVVPSLLLLGNLMQSRSGASARGRMQVR